MRVFPCQNENVHLPSWLVARILSANPWWTASPDVLWQMKKQVSPSFHHPLSPRSTHGLKRRIAVHAVIDCFEDCFDEPGCDYEQNNYKITKTKPDYCTCRMQQDPKDSIQGTQSVGNYLSTPQLLFRSPVPISLHQRRKSLEFLLDAVKAILFARLLLDVFPTAAKKEEFLVIGHQLGFVETGPASLTDCYQFFQRDFCFDGQPVACLHQGVQCLQQCSQVWRGRVFHHRAVSPVTKGRVKNLPQITCSLLLGEKRMHQAVCTVLRAVDWKFPWSAG